MAFPQGASRGSQGSTPRDVYTTSNRPERSSGRSGISAWTSGLQLQLDGEGARELQGPFGEVHAGDVRPQPGPRQGVQAEVALQVEEVLPGHRSDLLELEVVQMRPAGLEPLQVVQV